MINWKDYPYELHLTIDNVDNIDDFIKDCAQIGNLKPVILDLYSKNNTGHQVTTSTYIPAGEETTGVSFDLKNKLKQLGYKVIRVKWETVPWHPYATQINPLKFKRKEVYFETHYKFELPTFNLDDFKKLYQKGHMRLSKNVLKSDIDGVTQIMGTVRTYFDYDDHKVVLAEVEKDMTVKYIKKISEFAFQDSKRSLDKQWLRA
jgi:hypothetical protein